MNWKVISTEKQYQEIVRRTLNIFDSEPGTELGDELALLLLIIKDYEEKNIVLPSLDPIEVIKFKMEENGIVAKDLIPLIGSKGHVSSILSGRRELTLNLAKKLKNYFNLPADLFMQV